jgi:serine beta-lactamase-like protein LACTB
VREPRPGWLRLRRRARASLGAALLVACLDAQAAGQTAAVSIPAPDRDARAIAAARRLMEKWMYQTSAPAALVAVSRDGKTVWSEAFGCADLEQQVPATRQTAFRIGSVSKPLTSAALGMLVEEGRLDLDAPIQQYVPDFPKKTWPITTRQLAGHLAGIRHYEGSEFENQRHFDDVRSGLSFFEKDALVYEPGTRYSYSSYGWNLLSAVLEGASGEPFLELMSRRVFGPAGMRETAADDPGPVVPHRGRFYTRDEKTGALRNALYVDNSYKWAGGGFVSTADDLLRFANALMEGRLLKPETVRLLWTSLKTREGKETGYGLGWGVGRDAKGRERVSHSGGAQGSTAYLILFPAERLAVAMIVNSDESFTGRTPRIAEIFLDGEEAARRWESRDAGFSFAIPASWEERYGVATDAGEEAKSAHPKAMRAVSFRYIPTGRGREAERLVTFLAFPRADWESIAGEEGPPVGEIVVEKGDRVWVAVLPQSNPYPPGTPDAKGFDQMRLPIDRVRAGFRVLAP